MSPASCCKSKPAIPRRLRNYCRWCMRNYGSSRSASAQCPCQHIEGSGHLHHRLAIQEREQRLQLQLYATDVAAAWDAWFGGDQRQCMQLLDRHRPASDERENDSREFAWYYLALRANRLPLSFSGHDAPVLTAAISPDGRLTASADRSGSVRVWQTDTARQILQWNYSNKEVCSVDFSPNGSMLATGGQDSTVRLWSVGRWEELARLSAHEHSVMSVAWSPDGSRLASSCRCSSLERCHRAGASSDVGASWPGARFGDQP